MLSPLGRARTHKGTPPKTGSKRGLNGTAWVLNSEKYAEVAKMQSQPGMPQTSPCTFCCQSHNICMNVHEEGSLPALHSHVVITVLTEKLTLESDVATCLQKATEEPGAAPANTARKLCGVIANLPSTFSGDTGCRLRKCMQSEGQH